MFSRFFIFLIALILLILLFLGLSPSNTRTSKYVDTSIIHPASL